MQIDMRSIESIKPYENNPRQNDAGVDAVAKSLQEFGWRQPIVVDEEGVIVVGHTRYKAALKLGMIEVPVHVAAGLTPAQLRGYRLADNSTASLSTWDDDKLTQELIDLQKQGFDLDLTGFGSEQLKELMNVPAVGLTDEDAIPDPPDAAITQPGDLIVLGNHRLYCGDSSKPEDVDLLLNGATIQLANCDPPYGVGVSSRSNNSLAVGNNSLPRLHHHQQFDFARQPSKTQATHAKLRPKDRPLENDFLSEEAFDELLDQWFANIARVLEPGRCFYIWGGYANLGNYPGPLKRNGLYFSQAVVWDKQHPVLTRKDMMGSFELAYYGWRVGAGHKFLGPNNATDLWHVKKVNPQSMVHLTEKPVELATRAIEYSSKAGENVLDLFGGSGSTLIAAEQTGRKAFLMEIDGLYCDIIVSRWEQFTGKKAERLNRNVA